MSLERSHPVFLGQPIRDRTPPRHRHRFLDDEIGTRAFRWKYRRYICILGEQSTGRRSLAKRFFDGRGDLITDGNWWLRGTIRLTNATCFSRGEVDLLIRIVPSPDEMAARDNRIRISAGMHGNAALYMFAFVCAQVRTVRRIEILIRMFRFSMVRNEIPAFIVGTKSDLRPLDLDERIYGYLSEDAIRRQITRIFRPSANFPYRRPPPYMECSVRQDVNVPDVINTALDIMSCGF